jgi:hypothetical protein
LPHDDIGSSRSHYAFTKSIGRGDPLGQEKSKRCSPILDDEVGRADPRLPDEGVEIARIVRRLKRDLVRLKRILRC